MIVSGNGQEENVIDLDHLLEPTPVPNGFKRENPTAFRFQPYSRKVRRRLDIYTSILYDLWVSIEWDPSIRIFNERVDQISIGCMNGNVVNFKPRFVTVNKDEELVVHSLAPTEPEINQSNSEAIESWAKTYRVSHKVWTLEEIRLNPVELENQKQLYAYIGSPETAISPALREEVLLALRRHRKTTLDDLIASVTDVHAEQVLQVIAEQLMLRNIHSDIHMHHLGWATEISSYHEFT